ncbi:zinc ribbon domain-containing protein [Companilactobacillus jidongensis]|uniref:hypothetical protein n=1 Tax=Companilactobacillus jidongensis TaxID=2486006 RepID=UPI000F7B26C6|nr:hypothetical protein [Companilactobacillus jidongensis]
MTKEILTRIISTCKKILKIISKRKPYVITALIIVIILLTFGYFSGLSHYTKYRQLDNLSDNVTSGVPSKMASAIVTSNGNAVSKQSLEPLNRLFAKNNRTISQIKTIIEHESSYSNFQIVRSGKYWGLYPKYKVLLNKRNIIIETNINNPIFEIAGKSVSAKKIGNEYYLKKSIPGLYYVRISNKSGSYKKTRAVTVPVSGNCDETEVDVTMRHTPAL